MHMRTRIKEYRARHGMTQQQLADAVGARRETIVLVEGGKYNPTLRLAHKIAATLHSTIDDIFLFEDEDGIV